MTYTSKQITEMFQFSYEYLRQLRNGIYSFKLIKGEDWYWQDGKIIYTQSAVDKLTLRAKGQNVNR